MIEYARQSCVAVYLLWALTVAAVANCESLIVCYYAINLIWDLLDILGYLGAIRHDLKLSQGANLALAIPFEPRDDGYSTVSILPLVFPQCD